MLPVICEIESQNVDSKLQNIFTTYDPIRPVNLVFAERSSFCLKLLLETLKNSSLQVWRLDFSRANTNYNDIPLLTEILKTNPFMKVLNLKNKLIGKVGARAITNVLKDNNNTLTTLNLKWNKITDEGALTIAHAVKDNISLKTLNLERNKISEKGKQTILGILKDKPKSKGYRLSK